jgi:hypothetical protein
MPNDLRALITQPVIQHPRVAQQTLIHQSDDKAILSALPPLPGFRTDYVGGIAVLDWDHKLPSQRLFLRVLGYYSESSFSAGRELFERRNQEITEQNRFPEFDVPDFSTLFADDAYECEVTPDASVGKCRLTSSWRRQIEDEDAKKGRDITLGSNEYENLIDAIGSRPNYLGELEAVSYIPPCESELPQWTLDVWYLLSFDGRFGTGKSFLVDLGKETVVAVRDFSVRAN